MPRIGRPRAALSRATCPPAPCPPPSRPRAGLSLPLHVAPPPPEPPRMPPALPAPARARSASPGLKTCSAAAPRSSLLTQALLFHGISFPRAQLLVGAPSQPLANVVSRPRRLPPAIQCSSSTAVTPCSSLTHPISLSCTRASSPAAPASSSSTGAQPRRRLAAAEPLSPSQGRQQHLHRPPAPQPPEHRRRPRSSAARLCSPSIRRHIPSLPQPRAPP
jgi:hypothetical protein